MIDTESVDAALREADRRNRRHAAKPPSDWPEVPHATCDRCGHRGLRLRSELLQWPRCIVAVMLCEGCNHEQQARRWWRPGR